MTLMRGPADAHLGTQCCHVRWHVPPSTSRSPLAGVSRSDRPPPFGRSRNRRGAPSDTMATTVCAPPPTDAVAVPGHAVAPVAVEVGGHGRAGRCRSGGTAPRPSSGTGSGGVVPRPGRQPRLDDHPVVHRALVRRPRCVSARSREQRVGAATPSPRAGRTTHRTRARAVRARPGRGSNAVGSSASSDGCHGSVTPAGYRAAGPRTNGCSTRPARPRPGRASAGTLVRRAQVDPQHQDTVVDRRPRRRR